MSRRVRYPSPPKERVRSPMSRRIDGADLRRAPIANVMRLANALGINIDPKSGESEGGFRHRLISAICRWEKLYQRGT